MSHFKCLLDFFICVSHRNLGPYTWKPSTFPSEPVPSLLWAMSVPSTTSYQTTREGYPGVIFYWSFSKSSPPCLFNGLFRLICLYLSLPCHTSQFIPISYLPNVNHPPNKICLQTFPFSAVSKAMEKKKKSGHGTLLPKAFQNLLFSYPAYRPSSLTWGTTFLLLPTPLASFILSPTYFSLYGLMTKILHGVHSCQVLF